MAESHARTKCALPQPSLITWERAGISALSGMLITTGMGMLNPAEFKHCYAVQKIDSVPFVTTIGGMLAFGLAEGIGIGCATALALNYQNWNPATLDSTHKMQILEAPTVFHKMAQAVDRLKHEHPPIGISSDSHGNWNPPDENGHRLVQLNEAHMYHTTADVSTFLDTNGAKFKLNFEKSAIWQVNGPINFISMFEIDDMVQDIKEYIDEPGSNINSVVLDMHSVTNLEFTGVEELVNRLVEVSDTKGTDIQMVNCSPAMLQALDQCNVQQITRFSALTASD